MRKNRNNRLKRKGSPWFQATKNPAPHASDGLWQGSLDGITHITLSATDSAVMDALFALGASDLDEVANE
jgi:hypothetical protein